MNETDLLLKKIESTPTVQEALGWFEFRLQPERKVSATFRIENAEPPVVIARDASGGEFALVTMGDEDIFVYVTSESAAGVPAPTLKDYLSLLLAFPNWWDLCLYSGGGQMNEMQRAYEFLLPELEESQPQRANLASLLQIELCADPVNVLYRNLKFSDERLRLLTCEGAPMESTSFFREFTIENHPFYRG